MIWRRSRAALAACVLVAGCSPSGSPQTLRPEERAFVDTYVRILILDAHRANEPDSASAALDRLGRSYDSTAVRSALAQLEVEPERWELVYGEIARRLRELERQPTPLDALRALDAGEVSRP